MSDGGSFTQTGVNEMRAAVQQLPTAVTAALRGVAEATAKRMLANAKAILRERLKTDRHALIDALVIEENAANHEFRVISKSPSGQSANLPIWIEYGTVKMGARPYMHPSAEAELDQYRRDCETASAGAASRLIGD